MNWYKFRLSEYLAETGRLADAEDLAYRRLIDLYYLTEEPIPLNTKLVAIRIGLDLDITETVLHEFFDESTSGYVHRQIEDDIKRRRHQAKTNQNAGRQGGRPKKTLLNVKEDV